MPRPQLEPGEQVLFTLPANRAQGARAVGGRLVVTDRALRFVANRIDRATGGDDATIERRTIESATVDAAELEPDAVLTGAIRRRLRVTTTSSTELFVVHRPARAARRLTEWATQR